MYDPTPNTAKQAHSLAGVAIHERAQEWPVEAEVILVAYQAGWLANWAAGLQMPDTLDYATTTITNK